jgi:hypothetical protein
MLAGLADDGLEGLALLPGNQRFFVGIGHPLAAPADFDGARVAMVRTPFADRFVESLGAEPVEIELDDRAAYEEHGIDGLLTVADNLGLFPDTYMTANLVPYTVPVSVLANAAAMAELRAAAIEVRDQMLDEMPSVESAAVRCGTGGAVIEASDADVLALEAGTRPVRDWLATDAATAGFIERIEALKAGSPPPAWPATCGTVPPVGASLAAIPDGTYRAVGTRQDSLRTGWASDCDLELVDEHIALVVENSGASWSLLVACGDSPLVTGAAGTYEYSDAGDQFTVLEPGYPRGQTFAWSLDGGALTLTMVEPGGASEEDVAAGKFLFERTFTMDAPDEVLGRIPDGTYTTEVTEADAVRTGWEDICTLNGQVKTVTLVIEGERFTELQSCDDGPAEIGSEGTFEYAADRLVVREPGYSGGPTFAWSVDGETLSLQVVDPYDEGELGVLQFLFEHDFVRSPS